jgi:D-3-phosphoglycerate dehydrogenase / 2-oxoglutarate reductase
VNIIILDDYQDAVRKLKCASILEHLNTKVFTNTVKGFGQLSVRVRDADVLVLIRERSQFPRQLLEKLPKLKLIAQTGRVGPHIDLDTCTRLGIAVAEGVGSPVAPAELTWALIMAAMRRLPHYISTLKHGAWQQSGLKAAGMPANFGIGLALKGRTLGIWGFGKIGQLVAGYGKAFGMRVQVSMSMCEPTRPVCEISLSLGSFSSSARGNCVRSRISTSASASRRRIDNWPMPLTVLVKTFAFRGSITLAHLSLRTAS